MIGELFRPIFVGGTAAAVREVTEDPQVYPDRMQENLDITRGLLLSENVTTIVAQKLGRLKAQDLVKAASNRALNEEKPLRQVLLEDTRLRDVLSEGEIDTALDPARYLGSGGEFVDRALRLYRQEVLA